MIPPAQPSSFVKKATAGVGTIPAKTTSSPLEVIPATKAPSSIAPGGGDPVRLKWADPFHYLKRGPLPCLLSALTPP